MHQLTPYYAEIETIYTSIHLSIQEKYPKLRTVLEQACRQLTRQAPIQFTNLFSRQNWLVAQHHLEREPLYWLNGLRITANEVLHANAIPNPELFPAHVRGLCDALSCFAQEDVPLSLRSLLPASYPVSARPTRAKVIDEIRCLVLEVNGNEIRCTRDDDEAEVIIVLANVVNKNVAFRDTVEKLFPGMALLLWKSEIDAQGRYIPLFLVAEPDFLVEASTLAECYKDQGTTPLHYLFGKFQPRENTIPLLLGNLVNGFVDEIINEHGSPVAFPDALRRGFRQAAVEFTGNKALEDKDKLKDMVEKAKGQFDTVRKVIEKDFPALQQPIDPARCVLEPSFVSDKFGILGRLDLLMLHDGSGGPSASVVELKSGKEPFQRKIGINHERQLMTYELLLQSALELNYQRISTNILYPQATKDHLRNDAFSITQKQELINLRNLLVLLEYNIANDHTADFSVTRFAIQSLTLANLITRDISPNFRVYVEPPITRFNDLLQQATPLERDYFFAFVNFVAREFYLSRCGDGNDGGNARGQSALWRTSFNEKKEQGDILYDLEIDPAGNLCDKPERTIVLLRTEPENRNANFRAGDIVMLYPKKENTYKATRDQVFKGSIVAINQDQVTVQLRYQQRQRECFTRFERWAAEKDSMDSGYHHMNQSLAQFLKAEPHKRQLLLGLEKPAAYELGTRALLGLTEEQRHIVNSALSSRDYFLIVGPPGTGKTSIAIRTLVRELLLEKKNILVLAYTNRAVDELCLQVQEAGEALAAGGYRTPAAHHLLRIGSGLSCEPEQRRHLLDRQLEELEQEHGTRFNREHIRTLFQQHQVVAGTLSSILGKTDLFELKQFDVVIVDEASQILEPQLIGLLAQVPKFILVGDHKQLPAIVLQDENRARVALPSLHAIGLETRSNSLFERLHRTCQDQGWNWACATLTHQGRLHADLLSFPNELYYEGKLKVSAEPAHAARQQAPMQRIVPHAGTGLEHYLAHRRQLFIPSEPVQNPKQQKAHEDEARALVVVMEKIVALYEATGKEFKAEKSLGVITPYRNQIAAIRYHMEQSAILQPYGADLVVDTVERFQGSQREIILISLAVSTPFQLRFLVGNTRSFKQEGTGELYEVDRKLNVSLTRGMEQVVITGAEQVLARNPHYRALIEHIRDRGGYVPEGVRGVIDGTIRVPPGVPDTKGIAMPKPISVDPIFF
ncbi:MAG: hypothetical protein EOO15_03050 [Chitinophagaceae bacterium]|nr:MAG: hypothetical protein EOO15_03050 [Chitinophagaceae bacterium]